MNKNLEEFLKEQSREYMLMCFEDLEEFRKTGVLKDSSEIRRLNDDYFNGSVGTLFTVVGESVYREIAVRYFKPVSDES